MDIRQITPTYAVSPQIEPTDIPAIKAAGFTTILCNRPDPEIPGELSAQVMRIAAEAAGLEFRENPVVHTGLTMDVINAQGSVIDDSSGPVLAYCASGTRSTIVWGLSQAGCMDCDAIINAARDAGYDLAHMKPQLQQLAGS